MSYPTGFDEKGLSPIVIIKDKDGVEQYRYETDQAVASPPGTKEFDLVAWQIDGGINSNHGMCQLLLDDRAKALLDTTKPRRPIKMKNSWELIVQLGKDSTSVETWFDGIIEEPELVRTSANLQYIRIVAFGWGIRTAHRQGIMERAQKKLANGLDMDTTDTDAKVSELFKDVLVDGDVPAFKGLGNESITTTGVADVDIKLADYHRKFQSLAMMLNELAAIPGAIYGVDPSKDAFYRLRGSVFGGYLITTDTESPTVLTTNWNQSKIMFLRNTQYTRKESTIDSGYTACLGIGGQHPTLDYDQATANALLDLSSKHFAFPWTPGVDNVGKVACYLSKVNSPATRDNLHCCIVGDDGAGAPDEDDIRQRIVISGIRLENELASAKYFESRLEKIPVTHGEKLFILFTKYPDATNPIKIDYQTGTGSYYDSTDGLSWTLRTGDAKFRVYSNKTMHCIGQNTVARKTFRDKETTVSLTDFPNEDASLTAMEGVLETLGKTKFLYSPLTVSAPTNRPDLGKTARFIDVFNGIDVLVDVIGYTIGGSAFDNGNLGADTMQILVEEWSL